VKDLRQATTASFPAVGFDCGEAMRYAAWQTGGELLVAVHNGAAASQYEFRYAIGNRNRAAAAISAPKELPIAANLSTPR